MHSLKARMIAFAIPALGLLVSGPNTTNALGSENLLRTPVVSSVTGSKQITSGVTHSNQLRIRSNEQLENRAPSISFVQRLPATESIEREVNVANATATTMLQIAPPNKAVTKTSAPRMEVPSNVSVPIVKTPVVIERLAELPVAETPTLQVPTFEAPTFKAPNFETPNLTAPQLAAPQQASAHALPANGRPNVNTTATEEDTLRTETVKEYFYREHLEDKKTQEKLFESKSDYHVAKVKKQPIKERKSVIDKLTFPIQEEKVVVEKTQVELQTSTPRVAQRPTEPLETPAAPSRKQQTKADLAMARPAAPLASPQRQSPTSPQPQRQAQPQRQRNGWSPVDMRTVNVDANLAPESQLVASQATRQDKLQAQKAVQMGFELVQRRAHYSARARFTQALRIVARSLDDQTFSTRHSNALRNALKAYEEAVDFYPTSGKPGEDIKVDLVIGGHDTPVLQTAGRDTLSARQCVREYMAYAEQEFANALGNESFASQALYGLGRLEAAKETTSTSSPQVRANRSLMLYQTALIVDQQNFAAANELGVLLAQYGKYGNAIEALRHCVKFSPEPTAWRNLANIYRRMGNVAEAQMAEAQAQTIAANPGIPFVATQPKVEWVSADEFAAMNAESNLQVTRRSATPPQATPQPAPPASGPPKTANKRFWPFGRK